jgi:very-short-patch-repair endonuclease
MDRCGRPTRKGTPCQLLLLGGRCPTHDVDLSARNAAVRSSYRRRDRTAYRAHQSTAGKAGFRAAGLSGNFELIAEKARLWRIKHPSEPERWALRVLESAGLNHFVREYDLGRGYSIDLAWPDTKRAIEIDGHPSRADAKEQVKRARRAQYKAGVLTAAGWQVLVIDATTDREAQGQLLIEFARAAQAAPADALSDEHELRF